MHTRQLAQTLGLLLLILAAPGSRPAAHAQGGGLPLTRTPITAANADRLVELARLEPDRHVEAVAWSPDGALLAVGGTHGIYLYQTDDLDAEPRLLAGHTDKVYGLAFPPAAPDDEGRLLLASGGRDGTVRLWDTSTGEELAVLEAGIGPVLSVAYTWSGQLAAGGTEGLVQVWTRYPDESGTLTAERLITLAGHADSVTAVAYRPDGMALASGSHDGTTRLWETCSLDEPAFNSLAGSTGPVTSLAYPATLECGSGRALLAVGGDRGIIQLWSDFDDERGQLPDWQVMGTLYGHASAVYSLAYGPEPSDCEFPGQPGLLASGGRDGTVRLWDVAAGASTGGSLVVLDAHRGSVQGVAFHPDGTLLASSSWDGTVRLWGLPE